MLINRLKRSYREVLSQVEPVQAIVTVPVIRPAANSNNFSHSEMQARRQRRERRLARASQYVSGGWTARAW